MVAAAPDARASTMGAPEGGAIRPTKLFIGGISRRTTTKQLRDHFSKRGRVLDCVAMRQPDGRPRGFAYVTLDSPAAAEHFLREPQIIDNRIVDLKPAVRDTSSVPASGGARGGGAWSAVNDHHWDTPQHIAVPPLSQQPAYCLGGDHFGLYGGLSLSHFEPAQHCWLGGRAFDAGGASPHSPILGGRAFDAGGSSPCSPASDYMRLLQHPTIGAAATAPALVGPPARREERPPAAPPPAVGVLGEVTNLLDSWGPRGGSCSKPKMQEERAALQPSTIVREIDRRWRAPSVALGLVSLSAVRDAVEDDDLFFVRKDTEDSIIAECPKQPPSSTASRASSPHLALASPSSTAPLPSAGSAGHASGECKRCNFFARGCCRNGADCLFCHFPHERRSRQAKRENDANQLAGPRPPRQGWQDDQGSDVSSAEDTPVTDASGDAAWLFAGPVPPPPLPPGLSPAPGLPLPPHLATLRAQPEGTALGARLSPVGVALLSPVLGSAPAAAGGREVRSVGTQTEPTVACPRCGGAATF